MHLLPRGEFTREELRPQSTAFPPPPPKEGGEGGNRYSRSNDSRLPGERVTEYSINRIHHGVREKYRRKEPGYGSTYYGWLMPVISVIPARNFSSFGVVSPRPSPAVRRDYMSPRARAINFGLLFIQVGWLSHSGNSIFDIKRFRFIPTF